MEIDEYFEYKDKNYCIINKNKKKHYYLYEIELLDDDDTPRYLLFQERKSSKPIFNLQQFFKRMTLQEIGEEYSSQSCISVFKSNSMICNVFIEKITGLNHPNILNYLEFFRLENFQDIGFIIIEKKGNISLKQLMLQNHMQIDEDVAISIIKQIFSAFLYLKNQNIPYNVMLNIDCIYVAKQSNSKLNFMENKYITQGSLQLQQQQSLKSRELSILKKNQGNTNNNKKQQSQPINSMLNSSNQDLLPSTAEQIGGSFTNIEEKDKLSLKCNILSNKIQSQQQQVSSTAGINNNFNMNNSVSLSTISQTRPNTFIKSGNSYESTKKNQTIITQNEQIDNIHSNYEAFMGFYGLEEQDSNQEIQQVQDWQKLGLLILELLTGKPHMSNRDSLSENIKHLSSYLQKIAIEIYDLIDQLVHHQFKQVTAFIKELKQLIGYYFIKDVPSFQDQSIPNEQTGIYLPNIISKVKKVNKYAEFIENSNMNLGSSFCTHSLNQANQTTSIIKIHSKFEEYSTCKSKTSRTQTLLNFDTKTIKNQSIPVKIKGPCIQSDMIMLQENQDFKEISSYYHNKQNQISFQELGIKAFNQLKDEKEQQFLIGKYLINKILMMNLFKYRDEILLKNSPLLQKDPCKQDIFQEFCCSKICEQLINYFEEKIEEKLKYQGKYTKKIIDFFGEEQFNKLEDIVTAEQLSKKIQELGHECFVKCCITQSKNSSTTQKFVKQKNLHYLLIILSSSPEEFLEGSRVHFDFSDYFDEHLIFTYGQFQKWILQIPSNQISQYCIELTQQFSYSNKHSENENII